MDISHRSVGYPCLEAKLAPISIVISYRFFDFLIAVDDWRGGGGGGRFYVGGD